MKETEERKKISREEAQKLVGPEVDLEKVIIKEYRCGHCCEKMNKVTFIEYIKTHDCFKRG